MMRLGSTMGGYDMLDAGRAMMAVATLRDEDGNNLPQHWEGDNGLDIGMMRLGSTMGGYDMLNDGRAMMAIAMLGDEDGHDLTRRWEAIMGSTLG